MKAEIRAKAMLIGSEWERSRAGADFVDRDPSTGETLVTLPDADAEDVDRAVDRASEALAEWSGMRTRRGRLLARLADLLEEGQERISVLESSDNGRPRRETAAQARIVASWYTATSAGSRTRSRARRSPSRVPT
jgi:acyl-CoA reductase-like NAD-dependent aldehyde dehydrogenase